MGHVNAVTTYLEAACFSWRRPALRLTEHGFIVARVEIDSASRRSRRAPPIRLRVDSLGRSSLTVAYDSGNGRTRELVAEARSVQVASTMSGSQPLSDDFRAKLEAAY
jgi:acyl-CoA thioesterase FadM